MLFNRTPTLDASASHEVKIEQEKRTAIVSIQVDDKEGKKSEKQIKLIEDKCKEYDVSINGKKSNMSHVLTSKGIFNKSTKEEANLHWSAFVEGTNTAIGNLSEALFKEMKSDAPKITFKQVEPTPEEVIKAEDEAIAVASKLAKKRAEALAAVFGVELDEVLKLTYNTYKTKDTSYEDAFDECDFEEAPMMMADAVCSRYRAVESVPVDPKTVSKAVANVNVTFKIKSKK